MASLTRSTKATYTIHEKVTVNTSDREEHTFCGVMFPIQCKEILPIDHILLTSISVRGALGPLTIWVTKDENNTLDTNLTKWKKIYSQTHKPNYRNFVPLELSESIKLKPGEIKGVYIHSALPGDQAIVYDNHYGQMNRSDTLEDSFVKIHAAVAHVSNTPFGDVPIWGWGNAWRVNRKFVGRISYGIVYKLWHPKYFNTYGSNFQRLVQLLLLCQRRHESPISKLPDDCIFYILHLCKWDWMDDCYNQLEDSFLNRYMSQLQNVTTTTTTQPMDESTSSSGESDEDEEWDDENAEEEDDEEYYEDFINHIQDQHDREINNRARTHAHHHESSHTLLFDSNTVQREYKDKYYANHSAAAADGHQENRSVRSTMLNRIARSANGAIGINYFTMLRSGSGRGVVTRRRIIHGGDDDDDDDDEGEGEGES